uniref:Transcription factor domain-containing protein n=1 Tax=Kwoniella bestiolae CBS 10118 TaxID=1296100 RepID=A0A1B9G751_9TREE|nr:hypothetical protein I302_04532 [Kwoniella bestiolae CBS 10118]OCF26842.1 hypothetical protein I302_04532 [Kwoniella bestiolae CBS 10118]
MRFKNATGPATYIRAGGNNESTDAFSCRVSDQPIESTDQEINSNSLSAPTEIAISLPVSSRADAHRISQVSLEQDTQVAATTGTIQNGRFSSAPIQTLRGLIGRSKSPITRQFPQEVQDIANGNINYNADPVSRGILTMDEAQRLFDIFFEACHELAPCSWIAQQRDAKQTRRRSSFLFTSICLIGARYWDIDDPIRSTHNWLHPRYSSLVSMFDEHIQLLLLRPSPSDFTLEVVQSLLLSIQWPAVDIDPSHTSPKSRFTDSYAWLMIGLATRFAKYIGLEDAASVDFADHQSDSAEENLQRMRVWLNLISVDRHLTLTAGLPATLVTPPTSVLRAFGSHPKAQSGDLKLAGLAELVAIVHRASISCGDVSLRKLDSITLSVANAELDSWEREWDAIFSSSGAAPTFKQQMPFTALRWYRLALNATPIGVELGDIQKGAISPTPAALKTGVDAAFRLLWQYSTDAVSERPERLAEMNDVSKYTMNFTALSSFMFAVDSYWITHAYAAVFLVLVYDRGCIDANLTAYSFTQPGSPPPVPESSPLYRIISFAASLFDGICQGAVHHPSMQYRSIVANALNTLEQYQLAREESSMVPVADGIDEMLNALFDPGQDWAFLRDMGYTG